MAILNPDDPVYILTDGNFNTNYSGDLTRPCPYIFDQRWFVKNYTDKDYWYLEFLNTDAFYHFPIDTIIPEDILNRIKNKEVTLLLCNAHEPYHEVVSGIYEYVVKKFNVPPEQVLLVTMSHDIHLEINAISKKYKLGKIKAESIQEFEFMAKMQYFDNIHDADTLFATNTLQYKNYEKKFLSFNGFPRNHRLTLVSLLHCFDLQDKGYISFIIDVENELDALEMYKKLEFNNYLNSDLLSIIKENKDKILQIRRMFLDTTPETHTNFLVANYCTNPKQYYEDTYFSLVTETMSDYRHSADGYTLGRSLSEKIYKPIINKHPFILSAVPGSLRTLKNLGYKTFSPYIDESYDDEIDDGKRMLKIVKEVKRLSELSGDSLREFLDFSKEIVNHNFKNILNKNKWCYKLN